MDADQNMVLILSLIGLCFQFWLYGIIEVNELNFSDTVIYLIHCFFLVL